MSKSTYLLKLPTSVKTAAASLANAEGVSLNQFIAVAVAEKVGYGDRPRVLGAARWRREAKGLAQVLAQGGTRAAGRIGPSIGSAGHPGSVARGW
jgi:hypothetical protein